MEDGEAAPAALAPVSPGAEADPFARPDFTVAHFVNSKFPNGESLCSVIRYNISAANRDSGADDPAARSQTHLLAEESLAHLDTDIDALKRKAS